MTRVYKILNSLPLYLLSAIGIALLIVLTLRPSSELDDVQLFPMADKVVHFVAFGLVSVAIHLDNLRYFKNLKWYNSVVIGISLTILGILIEIAQETMALGRSADLGDVVADALGVFILPFLLLPQIKKCSDYYKLDIRPWKFDNKILNFIKDLYFDSFPENERRPWNDFHARVLDKENRMKLLVIYTENRPVGFITCWQLDNGFRYVEHFAISSQNRGKGIGARAIESFVEIEEFPVVLEAEPKHLNEIASRRIDFYTRCGFYPHNDYKYIQPSYSEGLEPVELTLLTTEPQTNLDYLTIQLHTIVYGVNYLEMK